MDVLAKVLEAQSHTAKPIEYLFEDRNQQTNHLLANKSHNNITHAYLKHSHNG